MTLTHHTPVASSPAQSPRSLVLGILAGLVWTHASVAHAGGIMIGNGGDLVDCGKPSASPRLGPTGLVVLDYALSFSRPEAFKPSVTSDGLAPLETIGRHLSAKVPELGASFALFRKGLLRPDAKGHRDWTPAKLPLIDIDDDAFDDLLPASCRGQAGAGKGKLRQVVIREKTSRGVRYHFDAAGVKEISKTPLQFSLLMTHEWLWDHVSTTERNRAANLYLNSQDFRDADAVEARSTLSSLGL